MAWENPGYIVPGLKAAADLSAEQYTAMSVSAANTVNQVTTAGDPVHGVLLNKPAAAGRAAEVAVSGVVKHVAGAAVSAGAFIMTDTTGRAITATSGEFAYGVALEAAANANEIIPVLLIPGHYVP